jgi:hypothetical protein
LVLDVPAALEAPSEDADAELAEALAELGGLASATITINRINERGEEERLDRVPAREFDIYAIRDRYGAGTYWLYGRDGKQLRKKGRVIFGMTLEERRLASGRPASSAPPAGDSASAMREMFERSAARDREMMQLVVQALTARPTSPGMDTQTVIDTATKLAQLNKRDQGGTDTLEQLLRFHKLIREIGGDGGGESSGLVELGREFLHAMGGRQPLPAPGATPAGDPQMQTAVLIRGALSAHLPTLIKGAQAQSDPGVYAQLVLDQVPPMFLPALLEHLNKPDWFAVLVKIDGRVVPLQDWFEALRNEIVQATSQEAPPAP